jgi:hypothetical protein
MRGRRPGGRGSARSRKTCRLPTWNRAAVAEMLPCSWLNTARTANRLAARARANSRLQPVTAASLSACRSGERCSTPTTAEARTIRVANRASLMT